MHMENKIKYFPYSYHMQSILSESNSKRERQYFKFLEEYIDYLCDLGI